MMKTTLKWLLRIGLFFIGGMLLYGLIAVVLSLIPAYTPKSSCEKIGTIFVQTNGIHADIILPKALIRPELWHQIQPENNAQYLAFGWGDRGFYLETPNWDDLKGSTVLKALFWKSKSVMHVTPYLSQKPDWTSIEICAFQQTALNDFIAQSFEIGANGMVVKIPDAGYYRYDEFYEGIGSYSFFYTCNVWVNRAFQKSAIPTGLWSPFDFGILHHLR